MFAPRLSLASLSGESDARWARNGASAVGCAFLGGIAIDEPTRRVARQMVKRDRQEFLPPDPLAFIDGQLAALGGAPLRPAFNVRSTSADRTAAAADICADHGAILEVNAHCRQAEMCAVGSGETLLREPDRLCEQVRTAADAGADVSVKVRAELEGVDLADVAGRIAAAGARAIHVDAMDTESVVADVATAAPELFVIANNGVRDAITAREYLAYGADALSIGRASDRPALLREVEATVDAWFDGADTRATDREVQP